MDSPFLLLLFILAGFALLTGGAHILVNGSTGLAARLKVPDLVIGLTIVAFGTSAPELLVNVVAAIKGNSQIAITNVLGSNSINTFVILGLSALFFKLSAQRSTVRVEIPMSLFAAIAVLILGTVPLFDKAHEISRTDGMLLLLFFMGFIAYTIKLAGQGESFLPDADYKPMTYGKSISMIVLGLVALIAGAEFVVRSAVKLATAWGVAESVIGVTIVAFGTSLPELATSIVAASKKNFDIAIGNVVGSNIFNIFFILGMSAVIRPLPSYPNLTADAFMAALGSILILLFLAAGKKKTLNRVHGIMLLFIYAVYLAWIIGTL
ncbi:MAG: sodium:calcium antiporter [Bacteroidales bacterium]|jgi:cation:H+ antiporter